MRYVCALLLFLLLLPPATAADQSQYVLSDAGIVIGVPAGWYVREGTSSLVKLQTGDGLTRAEVGLFVDPGLRESDPYDVIIKGEGAYGPYLTDVSLGRIELLDGLTGWMLVGYAPYDGRAFVLATIGTPGGTAGIDLRTPPDGNGIPQVALVLLASIRLEGGGAD